MIIPIPDDEEVFQDCEQIPFEFTSLKVTRKSIKSISKYGSNTKKIVHKKTGKIGLKIGWTNKNVQDDDKQEDREFVKPKNLVLSQETLKKWYKECLLNPMDPETGTFMRILSKQDEINVEKEETDVENEMFRFQENSLAFCSQEDFNNNERY